MQKFLCWACGLSWHYHPDITSSAQIQPGIPVTSFLGQDSHFHYGGASGAAQPFSPLFLVSSSPCRSSQRCHSTSVSELSCLRVKIQTHLRDWGRRLTQMRVSWTCTSTSLLSAPRHFPKFFLYPSFFSFLLFFFFYWSNLQYFHILDEACTRGTEYTWPGNWEVQIIPSCGKAAINWGCQPL